MRVRSISIFFLMALSFARPAFAGLGTVWNYVSQYQFGIDYSNSIDYVSLSYSTPTAGGIPSSCQQDSSDSSKKRCTAGMVGGSSSGWGVFLEKAFKKQGPYYLDWDVGFGARYLSGQLPEKDANKDGLPLRYASFSLAAVVAKPYVQFGITPEFWPDILVSVGPALQLAMGNVAVNDETKNVMVGTSTWSGPMSLINGFFALEIVLKRFGEGAFSLMASQDFTGNGEGSKLYPGDVDGMSDIRGSFRRNTGGLAYGFGLKLVTPWP